MSEMYHEPEMVGLRMRRRSKRASIEDQHYILDVDVDAMFAEKDAEIERLKAWKATAAEFIGDACSQDVGKELGVPLGGSISAAVLPGIRALKARIEFLEKALEQAEAMIPADVVQVLISRSHGELAAYLRERDGKEEAV